MSGRRVLPFGDHALLVELESLDDVISLYAALERARPAGVVDLVPAARTIGVTVDPALLPLSVAAAWAGRIGAGRPWRRGTGDGGDPGAVRRGRRG